MAMANDRVMKFLFLSKRNRFAFRLRARIVVVPGADHPRQFFQMLVIRRGRFFLFDFGHAVDQPFAVAFHADRRVIGIDRFGVGPDDLSHTAQDGHIRGDELDGFGLT